jgi:hypothetical protein
MHENQYGDQPSPHFNDGNDEVAASFEPQPEHYANPDPFGAPPDVNSDSLPVATTGADNPDLPTTTSVEAGDVTDSTGGATPKKKRVPRGSDPSRDTIWTRNHAICSLGVLADLMLGGFTAARVTENAGKVIAPRLKEIAPALLQVSPWILNPEYLNCKGAVGFEKHGLEKYYFAWATNRVYYFFYKAHDEHPAYRRKANLRAVYSQFYDTFEADFRSLSPIREETAGDFWISVADRVPFVAPQRDVAEPQPDIAAPQPDDAIEQTDTAPEEALAD